MRALLVYESMFGNTQQVAEAVGAGLAEQLDVTVYEVGQAPTTVGGGIDLLVVGGPTHAFGLSRPATRKSAADQVAEEPERVLVSTGPGIREWLETVAVEGAPAAAAFDTRVRVRFLPGSAARAAQRRLRRLGCRLLVPAESFWAAGAPGPLRPGELERARQWGARLAAVLTPRRPVP
ncbi:flavodoxin family protein [Natronosporangium hydrolyticum]|uniref:Flavodoxin family protein n=2 Tax=Natronosporangium hydrolyticum TaxID=2811111 RepID=A0A895YQL2_9ACTN|nr:flavodoxin family protein [Natronosporangium hydrolyticum]